MLPSSSTGPMWLVNMRLNRRGGESSVPSLGHSRLSRFVTVSSRRSVWVRLSVPGQLVEAVAAVALGALDERVAERADVARTSPTPGGA